MNERRREIAAAFNHALGLHPAGRYGEALVAYRKVLADDPEHVEAMTYSGVVLLEQGKTQEAVDILQQTVTLAPRGAAANAYLANALLVLGRLEDAEDHYRRSLEAAPDDQAMWAYRGLLWQLTGDERASWLNDYERFVRPILLEPPASHDSLEGFLSDLGETLTSLHPSAAHPLEQTLRGGTQTPGELFNKPVPIIQALKAAIEQAIDGYIAGLPDDPSHPLLRRKTDRFAFSGAWSVRLKSDGFYVNHVHPKGWISSACYIELPDGMRSAAGSDRSGWIRFGQSPHGLGERDGGLSELSDGVARAFPIARDRGPTSPRHALLAERSESPSLWVIIIKTWYYFRTLWTQVIASRHAPPMCRLVSQRLAGRYQFC